MRARVSGATSARPLTTLDTVDTETPASRATAANVARRAVSSPPIMTAPPSARKWYRKLATLDHRRRSGQESRRPDARAGDAVAERVDDADRLVPGDQRERLRTSGLNLRGI